MTMNNISTRGSLKFLVMIGKNIFVDKLFLLLNISDFSLFVFFFYVKTATLLPEKSQILFPSNPTLKVEIP